MGDTKAWYQERLNRKTEKKKAPKLGLNSLVEARGVEHTKIVENSEIVFRVKQNKGHVAQIVAG